MACHASCRNRNIGISEFQRKIGQTPSTKKRRLRSNNRPTATSSKNYNFLALLRNIIMVTTMWYHSRKSASRIVANAWTMSTLRTTQQYTRGYHLHTRRRTIPSGTFQTQFQEWRPSHRLYASTTIVDEGSESKPKITLDTTITNTSDSTMSADEDWMKSPLVNPTITFETLLVPNAQLTKWITHLKLQNRLAKPDNWEFLKHVHPRIKLVQDYDDKQYKQLLLLPQEMASNHTSTGIEGSISNDDNDGWLSELLAKEDTSNESVFIQKGPLRPMSISSNQLSFQYILKRLLPESALPPPSAYEQIGHVAHFNLKQVHLPFKHLIGSALLESNSGDSIQTVVNKVGQVDGKFRTYECEILANNHKTENGNNEDPSSLLETTVVEDGISIELNVAECYWCTRLSGERKELIKDIIKGRKRPKANEVATKPLVVADVFCGAGAVCMLLAKKIKDQDKAWQPDEKQPQPKTQQEHPSLTILANDWNPKAIEYMKRSIATNGMEQDNSYHKFDLSCRDSYDFLSELGEEKQTSKANPYIKKKQKSTADDTKPSLMPDHVLMNFPLEAPQFLGAIRWWSWKRLRDEAKNPRFHVYTFARASSPRANDEEEMAINLVANELLPVQDFDDNVKNAHRRTELDEEFETKFSTRLVRDVAPGKVVVCVSFSVTAKLIRYMQGDFS